MEEQEKSLYARLGDYDAITAVVENLPAAPQERPAPRTILAKPRR
jgi:hypothetical protein